LELREPNDTDLAGRLEEIRVTMTVRVPIMTDHEIQPADPDSVDLTETVTGLSTDFEVEVDGVIRPLNNVFLDGELNSLDEPPTPLHRVVKKFDPPVTLFIAAESVLQVTYVAANVSEAESEVEFAVGGRERLAHVVRDATGGQRAWFASDGRIYSTSR
jgi:hypothetical protein